MSLYWGEPHEPSHSCPEFDEAIAEIEKARSINVDLRAWGNWWKEKAEELREEVDALQQRLAELEEGER